MTKSNFVMFAKATEDWCHICGKRTKPFAETSYPANAEHPSKNDEDKFIRICGDCLLKMLSVIVNDIALEKL
jgi:hypothetical protein